jgi:3-oxoacyl-(acyl-carrier-protein) synthase
MALFIRSAQSISPQDTFPGKNIPGSVTVYENHLSCVLPEFKSYFTPVERRRMSRIIKAGVACAEEAIREAEISKPAAIISGTGLGCVEDTEKFLHNVLTSEEGLLSPTAFVQSTHNSIGATIALKYNCMGYNVLHAHKTISFENALLDANLQIMEKKTNTVLVGGFDEITEENYELKRKVGLFKKETITNLELVRSNTKGSIPGEGVTYFVVTGKRSTNDYAQIEHLNFIHKLDGFLQVEGWISRFLRQAGLTPEKIDNFMVGINGDVSGDELYYKLIGGMFDSSNALFYKNLCGEYDTASSFGTWLAAKLLKKEIIPDHIILEDRKKPLNNLLMYNQEDGKNHSLILLNKV